MVFQLPFQNKLYGTPQLSNGAARARWDWEQAQKRQRTLIKELRFGLGSSA